MIEHALVGECTDCGGQAIETSLIQLDGTGNVTLVCQDCGTDARVAYEIGAENPWEDPGVQEGVTDLSVEQVNWVGCTRCGGSGWIVGCIDDICHGKGHCIHDGNDPCPRCHTSGRVPVVDERGEPA